MNGKPRRRPKLPPARNATEARARHDTASVRWAVKHGEAYLRKK